MNTKIPNWNGKLPTHKCIVINNSLIIANPTYIRREFISSPYTSMSLLVQPSYWVIVNKWKRLIWHRACENIVRCQALLVDNYTEYDITSHSKVTYFPPDPRNQISSLLGEKRLICVMTFSLSWSSAFYYYFLASQVLCRAHCPILRFALEF